ncbi:MULTISPECIES: glycosyltransferase family 2 protein [unclassified Ensifer]|uniref:glycosyltransferase family 2 protein n=1 Tax=unclassified Ensifer TaxID=2633371 RepID=UPI000DD52C14|nr:MULTISPECIES: glycosyltransferase family 2 protein [unclassified Ensifer]MBD9499064.1 glycosyltransferase family 2 protein [Ensifer sp. ENS01]MBD9523006.1 glycosyltransferase family 2 protein [Ensifer sp. ENS02]
MRYPFSEDFSFPRRSLNQKIGTYFENWRISRRERREKKPPTISPLRDVPGLAQPDLPLVFITRNEIAILPVFLRHYRKLGITRFICIDDESSDGSREYLLQQKDVDVWTSPIRFAEARRGRAWREALFEYYGYDRWYVNVDTDEFLIYDQCPSETLRDLIRILEGRGISRLPAPMLDFYPSGETPQHSEEMPWKTINHFDGQGYEVAFGKRGISIKGGPRRRLFAENNELIKYPLIYWERNCFFGSSLHQPLPYQHNFSPIWGALLHFKFFANYREKINEAIVDQQHFNASQHYRAMKDEVDRSGSIAFMYENSLKFTQPTQLVELGFIPSITFDLDDRRLAPFREWTPHPDRL